MAKRSSQSFQRHRIVFGDLTRPCGAQNGEENQRTNPNGAKREIT
jgi:hypothetical protein